VNIWDGNSTNTIKMLKVCLYDKVVLNICNICKASFLLKWKK
jgi:hypothetical protein